MGQPPFEQTVITFAVKYNVIYGHYIIIYSEKTDLMKTKHWCLEQKSTLCLMTSLSPG